MRALGGAAASAPAVNVAPPQVNVHVVNVTDPNEVMDVLGTPEGERAIINVLHRRRREVRSATG
jgi:hypothetical protein